MVWVHVCSSINNFSANGFRKSESQRLKIEENRAETDLSGEKFSFLGSGHLRHFIFNVNVRDGVFSLFILILSLCMF